MHYINIISILSINKREVDGLSKGLIYVEFNVDVYNDVT